MTIKIDDREYVWERAGTVGVDSGHVLVTDPAYAKRLSAEFSTTILDQDAFGVGKVKETGIELGFVCQSGMGDGLYPVWIQRDKEGTITGLFVQFMDGSPAP